MTTTPRYAGASTATLPPTIDGAADDLGPGRAPADPTSSNPLHRLSPEEIERIGHAFEAIHDAVKADLGERDVAYIRNLITFQRRLAVVSRAMLMASRYPPAWLAGTIGSGAASALAASDAFSSASAFGIGFSRSEYERACSKDSAVTGWAVAACAGAVAISAPTTPISPARFLSISRLQL